MLIGKEQSPLDAYDPRDEIDLKKTTPRPKSGTRLVGELIVAIIFIFNIFY